MLAPLLLNNAFLRRGDDKIIRGGDDKLRRRKSEWEHQRGNEVRLEQTLRGLVHVRDERKRKRLYAELAVILMEMGELD